MLTATCKCLRHKHGASLFRFDRIVSLEQQAGIPAGYVYSNSSHEIDKWVTMDQRIIMHVYQYKLVIAFLDLAILITSMKMRMMNHLYMYIILVSGRITYIIIEITDLIRLNKYTKTKWTDSFSIQGEQGITTRSIVLPQSAPTIAVTEKN